MLKLRYLKKLIPEKIKRQIILKFVSSKDPQWMKFINSNHKKIFVFFGRILSKFRRYGAYIFAVGNIENFISRS